LGGIAVRLGAEKCRNKTAKTLEHWPVAELIPVAEEQLRVAVPGTEIRLKHVDHSADRIMSPDLFSTECRIGAGIPHFETNVLFWSSYVHTISKIVPGLDDCPPGYCLRRGLDAAF
jgi:hypothetical protein